MHLGQEVKLEKISSLFQHNVPHKDVSDHLDDRRQSSKMATGRSSLEELMHALISDCHEPVLVTLRCKLDSRRFRVFQTHENRSFTAPTKPSDWTPLVVPTNSF